MRIIEGHDYTFPLIGYERKTVSANRIVSPKQVYGTAFYIGNDYYLTAGHSIENAISECDVLAIGFIEADKYVAAEALEYEIMPATDTGLIKTIAHISRAQTFQWHTEPLASLIEVGATGYPYALDPDLNTIGSRSFKGYVVSRTKVHNLPARPWAYELSFASPRGLSGASLTTLGHTPRVAGLVVRNHSTEMLVFSSREVISDEKETVVERFEALQMGIAIQCSELMLLSSRILGETIGDYLDRNSLIERSALSS